MLLLPSQVQNWRSSTTRASWTTTLLIQALGTECSIFFPKGTQFHLLALQSAATSFRAMLNFHNPMKTWRPSTTTKVSIAILKMMQELDQLLLEDMLMTAFQAECYMSISPKGTQFLLLALQTNYVTWWLKSLLSWWRDAIHHCFNFTLFFHQQKSFNFKNVK